MQLICPKCGSRFELEQAIRELEQAETHDIAAKLGVHWRLVYEYSDCLRQSEFGNVSLTKRLRIFKEIARLMEETIWHPSQVLEKQADGSVIVMLKVFYTYELLSWILGWGEKVVSILKVNDHF